MTLQEYQDWVETRCTPRVQELGITYAALGLAGESGEVVEKIKKIIRDNRKPNDEDVAYLGLELGDVLWYVAKFCNLLGLSMSDVLDGNVQKLEFRAKYGKADAH